MKKRDVLLGIVTVTLSSLIYFAVGVYSYSLGTDIPAGEKLGLDVTICTCVVPAGSIALGICGGFLKKLSPVFDLFGAVLGTVLIYYATEIVKIYKATPAVFVIFAMLFSAEICISTATYLAVEIKKSNYFYEK